MKQIILNINNKDHARPIFIHILKLLQSLPPISHLPIEINEKNLVINVGLIQGSLDSSGNGNFVSVPPGLMQLLEVGVDPQESVNYLSLRESLLTLTLDACADEMLMSQESD